MYACWFYRKSINVHVHRFSCFSGNAIDAQAVNIACHFSPAPRPGNEVSVLLLALICQCNVVSFQEVVFMSIVCQCLPYSITTL